MADDLQTFIALFSPCRETFPGDAKPEEIAEVSKHFEELKQDQANGRLILAGRTMDHNPAGIYIFKAESQEAAEARMAEDSAIKSGVFKLHWVRPYSVALMSTAD